MNVKRLKKKIIGTVFYIWNFFSKVLTHPLAPKIEVFSISATVRNWFFVNSCDKARQSNRPRPPMKWTNAVLYLNQCHVMAQSPYVRVMLNVDWTIRLGLHGEISPTNNSTCSPPLWSSLMFTFDESKSLII